MNDWLLVLPIIIPFFTALVVFLGRNAGPWPRRMAALSAALLLASGLFLLNRVWSEGIIVTRIGSWAAPFGITLVADLFSAIMVVIAGIVGLTAAVYSLADIERSLEPFGYYSLLLVQLGGVCGAFLTGDLFNLYVWFEVLLMASFGLMVLGGTREQLNGAVNYVTLNLVSTILFLSAIGMIYGTTGALNMADLSQKIAQIGPGGLPEALAMMLLTAFGIKAALFPLFFWLPASYHTPPTAVSALFSGLLTKVGVYALIRVFTLIFPPGSTAAHSILLIIAIFTMVTGVLGAYAQYEIRRILSFHIVSQIGYLTLGLALATPLALAGSVFFMAHNIFAKVNLFFIGGVIQRLGGSSELKQTGGLYKKHLLLALIFIIPAASMAGFPPFSGFWAKLVLIKAGLAREEYLAVGAALGVGVLTLLSMTKIWNEAFWKPHPLGDEGHHPLPRRSVMLLLAGPIICLAALTLVMGLYPEPFLVLAQKTAEQLSNPDIYIKAVLGVNP